MLAIESLTDFDRGILLNVGTIAGGTKRNIVPDHASAWIDLRYDEPAEGEEMRAKLEEIARAVDVPGTSAKLWGRCTARPSRPSPAVDGAARAASRRSRASSATPRPSRVHSAAVTDGSLTAAVGLADPGLDGRAGRRRAHGARLRGAAELVERAAIAAVLLRRLARTPAGAEPGATSGLPASPAKLESSGPSPAVIAGSRPVVGP